MSYAGVPGLRATLDGPVLRLTLDRADRRNAVNDVMLDAMVTAIAASNTDERVRVIALDAAGPDFCAGTDLIANAARSDRKPRVGSTQRRLPHKANRLIAVMTETQVPIVAVVRGWSTGLGFHLALAADFCVAATDARFWEPFMARGFTPDSGATWLLPRLIGLARSRRLLMLGEEISGATAAEWGIIHAAHPDDELSEAAEELVARLAQAPTVALGLTKWLLQTGNGLDRDRQLHNEAMALELAFRSDDFKEGLAAFRDRREARFRGR
ncbi:enoyl-CoA hydratase/isomerase family protein [Mycolicibacterium thermoresistibile]|uniref:Enoyl-CoA hydratase n=2 Tax=Mycolicibacterium thermoresistibile TaxID=1797 RepID=G7CN38_MYCT3|nr:enoyl-CoA hydratase-related protein [Mycolicibacterium thermoresistibile]EHI10527.1 enoyl-CoA hydratase [Mycolicibacterium thermoresistibile ATCC 19527]MCV7189665.1 enoyl-CoA hydratase/isomerase family protein [Mycolicibacterium thermoresistibile]GAT15421.1 enoyl-CoA hydratase/carnithine racemase [Mycolicibacterium thermoresistibile]SNW17480.1 enoyl-CoA hydratase/carnithine racemase [Mycolicibacterium thermoresistibile]